MGGLFSSPKVEKPAASKPVRMPVDTDPSVRAAAERTRQATLQRAGRMSTIMTDNARATTGSSGQTLGA